MDLYAEYILHTLRRWSFSSEDFCSIYVSVTFHW
jgi:hypothetical protein